MIARVKVWLKTQAKRFLVYNLLIAPVVLALYVPYNFLWLHYTTMQFWRWIFTAALMYGAANIILAPWTAVVVRFLDRKYGARKVVPKVEVTLEAILGRIPTTLEVELWERLVDHPEMRKGVAEAKKLVKEAVEEVKENGA